MRTRPVNYVQWSAVAAIGMSAFAILGSSIAVELLFWFFNVTIGDSDIVLNFLYSGLIYVLSFSLIVLYVKKRGGSFKTLGFRTFKFWPGIGRVLLGMVGLLLVSALVFSLLEQTIPNLNLEEEQITGFESAANAMELALAFIVLVVFAPVVEETIFRGFMFQGLRKRSGTIVAAVISSFLFGIVHLQINVGIITFIMGLFMVWLFVRSHSLYTAILFHSLKNLIAFLALFGFIQ